jgi:rod shape-determining protein MreD
MLHHPDREAPAWLIASSLIGAMVLGILPLPQVIAAASPDWVLLSLIYWALVAPDRIGIGTAWLTGIFVDLLTGRALGQHALGYVLVAYLCLRLQRRLPHYPWVQQSVVVGVFLLLSRFVVFWTQEFQGEQSLIGRNWLVPALVGALVWPLLMNFLHALWHRSEAA